MRPRTSKAAVAAGMILLGSAGSAFADHISGSVSTDDYLNPYGLFVTFDYDQKTGGTFDYNIFDYEGDADPYGNFHSSGAGLIPTGASYYKTYLEDTSGNNYVSTEGFVSSTFNFSVEFIYYFGLSGPVQIDGSASIGPGSYQFASNSGLFSYSVVDTPSPVPVPSSLPMLGASLIVLGGHAVARRRVMKNSAMAL